MEIRNEDIPENPGELSGESPYTEFVKLVKKLLAEAKRIHPDGDIVLTYVAPGAQNIGHLETQNISYGSQPPIDVLSQGSNTYCYEHALPPSEIMVKVVEKTISDGYWWGNISWSVVYRIYQIKGYRESISQFVRDVHKWPFKIPIRYDCNDDSVGKPIRSGKICRDIDKWEEDGASAPFCILGNAMIEELKILGY